MPELVDMELPKKSKDELKKEMAVPSLGEQEKWPYGLRLRFEKDQIDKMPFLESVKVGDGVMVHGEASITEVRMSERQGGEDSRSVDIQIEKISVERLVKKRREDMTSHEYRESREKK